MWFQQLCIKPSGFLVISFFYDQAQNLSLLNSLDFVSVPNFSSEFGSYNTLFPDREWWLALTFFVGFLQFQQRFYHLHHPIWVKKPLDFKWNFLAIIYELILLVKFVVALMFFQLFTVKRANTPVLIKRLVFGVHLFALGETTIGVQHQVTIQLHNLILIAIAGRQK